MSRARDAGDARGCGVTRRPTLAQRAMEAEAIVRVYESRLWRRSLVATLAFGIAFEREQQMIGRAARLSAGDTLLDLACGPGIYTRPFAREVAPGLVLGLDLSPAMLRHARRRAPPAHHGHRLVHPPEELQARLRAVGLVEITCHHARAQWLIMSARRVDPVPGITRS